MGVWHCMGVAVGDKLGRRSRSPSVFREGVGEWLSAAVDLATLLTLDR